MPETILGLPLHPLVVHATVVVVPTAALAVALAALWPRFRRWAGWGPAVLAVAAVVLAPLSTSTGESLQAEVGNSDLVHEHAELGDMLVWWVLPLAALAVLAWWLRRSGRDLPRVAAVALLTVLPVLVAAGTLVQVVLIGHSGAKAAWSGVSTTSTATGGADSDGR